LSFNIIKFPVQEEVDAVFALQVISGTPLSFTSETVEILTERVVPECSLLWVVDELIDLNQHEDRFEGNSIPDLNSIFHFSETVICFTYNPQ